MQRLIIGFAIVGLGLGAWLLWPQLSSRAPVDGARTDEAPRRPMAPPSASTGAPTSSAPAASAQVTPSRIKKTPPIPPEKRAKPVYTPDPDDDRALVGLSFSAATDAERTRLKVPDRFGKGVVITSIHPDAPAAEAGLAVDDVIVRARRTAVNNEVDLSSTVGDRRHTVLTVSRDGKLFHVVLHKPFIPSETPRAN